MSSIDIHKTPFKPKLRSDGDGTHWYVVDSSGLTVAICGPDDGARQLAARFAALWNAAEGIATDDLAKAAKRSNAGERLECLQELAAAACRARASGGGPGSRPSVSCPSESHHRRE